MKTTVEELKAYYVKIGGQASDVVGIDTIPDMIAKITAISGGGGGSDLPEVTSDDNGDVLKVVDGEWAKADGNPAIYVNISELDIEHGTFLADKTYAEILSASENGSTIMAIVNTGVGPSRTCVLCPDEYDDDIIFVGDIVDPIEDNDNGLKINLHTFAITAQANDLATYEF